MLFISVALLGAFIWFIERKGETAVERQARARTVFELDAGSIYQLRLEHGEMVIECVKEAGGWKMTAPVEASVNEATVYKMLAGLSGVARGEVITEETLAERGLTPADYGFDAPRARITFRNNRGRFTWLVGRDATLGEALYVMDEAGRHIVVAEQRLLALIPKDAAWIRDTTLFAGEPSGIRGIDLRRPAGFVQLRQINGQGWQLQQPLVSYCDRSAVNAFLEQLFTPRIRQFVSDEKTEPAVYGLAEPAYEITLIAQDDSAQTLLIGHALEEDAEHVYAKWIESDSVYAIPASLPEAMEIELTVLRDRHVLRTAADDITEIRIQKNEQYITLVKTNGRWQVTRPAVWDADTRIVKVLLNRFTQARIKTFFDEAPAAKPTGEQPWIFQFFAGEKICTLRFAETPDADETRRLRRNDESSTYGVDAGLISPELAEPLTFKNRTVLALNPQTADQIHLTQAGVKRLVEGDALVQMLVELTCVQAVRYVPGGTESLNACGLAEPSSILSIQLTGTDLLGKVLLFGNRTDEGVFAMLQGEETVFVLKASTADTLAPPLMQKPESETTDAPQL